MRHWTANVSDVTASGLHVPRSSSETTEDVYSLSHVDLNYLQSF